VFLIFINNQPNNLTFKLLKRIYVVNFPDEAADKFPDGPIPECFFILSFPKALCHIFPKDNNLRRSGYDKKNCCFCRKSAQRIF